MNLTPNATSASTGALTGASVHAALSDASDSTYVTYDYGEYSTVSFSDLSLPSGAQLVSAQLKLRCDKTGTGPGGVYAALVTDTSTFSTGSVTWESPQELNSAFQFGGLTDAGLDAASATWTCVSLSQVTVYEASVSVLYLTKPVATVSAPSGTISTNLATVTWSGSYDVHTTSAPAYSDVKVFSSAQYSAGGFNPSTSTAVCSSGVEYGSSLSRAFSERLPDGNYRAYVRVAPGNASSLWSDWDYEAFTVSASLPDEPTIELSGENSRGRVRIDVECGANTDSVQVQRDSGDGFVNVRTADGDGMVALSDAGTVFDYEAPNGVTCDYRVRAYDESNATFSDWVEGTASWSSDDAWLKCVGDPSLNLSLTPRSYEGFDVPANQGVFRVLGSSEATVVQDTPGPMSGRVVFMTRSEDDRVALGSLLGSGSPVLLQVNGHPDRLVSLGDRSSTRLADHGWVEEHDDALVWTVVGEDDRVVGLGFWPYVDVVPLSRLALFLPLGASAGLTDLSGNGRNGTAAGGVTVGGVSEGPLVLGDGGATDFDGTDDRITTTYSTRRNLCVNPSFETNVTSWTATVNTLSQSSTVAYDGTYSLKSTATGAGARPYYASGLSAATPGTAYTVSFYGRVENTGRYGLAAIRFFDSGGGVLATTNETAAAYTINTWQRFSVTATAPALTAYVGIICYLDSTSVGTAGDIGYVDCVQIEAASSAGTFFPTVAQLDTGEAGWLGTAHASASDLGCFANGTSRTFIGWFNRDALGSSDVLFGGTEDAATGIIRLTSANFLIVTDGTSTASFTPELTNTGEWLHIAVVIDEPGNLAYCYINGQFYDDATMSFQYPTAGSLIIGAAGTSNPFDGKMAWVSVHERALTATEIQAAYNAGIGTATLGPYLT